MALASAASMPCDHHLVMPEDEQVWKNSKIGEGLASIQHEPLIEVFFDGQMPVNLCAYLPLRPRLKYS